MTCFGLLITIHCPVLIDIIIVYLEYNLLYTQVYVPTHSPAKPYKVTGGLKRHVRRWLHKHSHKVAILSIKD